MPLMALGGVLYKQEALHFHFALSPANYIADPSHPQVPEGKCIGSWNEYMSAMHRVSSKGP